jgi:hypothetical protein
LFEAAVIHKGIPERLRKQEEKREKCGSVNKESKWAHCKLEKTKVGVAVAASIWQRRHEQATREKNKTMKHIKIRTNIERIPAFVMASPFPFLIKSYCIPDNRQPH